MYFLNPSCTHFRADGSKSQRKIGKDNIQKQQK